MSTHIIRLLQLLGFVLCATAAISSEKDAKNKLQKSLLKPIKAVFPAVKMDEISSKKEMKVNEEFVNECKLNVILTTTL